MNTFCGYAAVLWCGHKWTYFQSPLIYYLPRFTLHTRRSSAAVINEIILINGELVRFTKMLCRKYFLLIKHDEVLQEFVLGFDGLSREFAIKLKSRWSVTEEVQVNEGFKLFSISMLRFRRSGLFYLKFIFFIASAFRFCVVKFKHFSWNCNFQWFKNCKCKFFMFGLSALTNRLQVNNSQ